MRIFKKFRYDGILYLKNKKFVVTDNDNIEISNLNRQFLFRKSDVGKPKSEIAIKSVQKMNPSLNAEGLQLKVCKETKKLLMKISGKIRII